MVENRQEGLNMLYPLLNKKKHNAGIVGNFYRFRLSANTHNGYSDSIS